MDGSQTNVDAENPPAFRDANELLAHTYPALRRLGQSLLANARSHSIEGTDLVHDAMLRLKDQTYSDDRHFFNVVAQAMRHALIDRARSRASLKRGEGRKPEPIDGIDLMAPPTSTSEDDQLAVLEALGDLESAHASAAEAMRLWLLGLKCDEIAQQFSISVQRAERLLNDGRAYLRVKLWMRDAAD